MNQILIQNLFIYLLKNPVESSEFSFSVSNSFVFKPKNTTTPTIYVQLSTGHHSGRIIRYDNNDDDGQHYE
ncbi:hypothetical protein DERP_002876 [Dermatophagoides pteronyssinus]|uniref:Uncharacterized protein n=1 Tax=Dermatophagoides pteronyssinus TaxID=6956 RepID=A0ABQ8JWW4_DERPT|nr:hypothetical protein DERP_002876 [Dermatophagoides pteronyssinus]